MYHLGKVAYAKVYREFESPSLRPMKRKLSNITLIGIDCVDVNRLIKALDISTEDIEFADVKLLTSLETDDKRKVSIPHLDTIEKYSEFCIRDLVKYVDTDFVLLVQHDGFILNPDSWSDDFLKYDYIGAPWIINQEFWFTEFNFPRELLNTTVVGNGGFCIRSKKFLKISSRLADQGVFEQYQPEDSVMCVHHKKEMEDAGVVFAPAEVAERFSIEGDGHVYDKQFGFHGFRWTDISKWVDENPRWGIGN